MDIEEKRRRALAVRAEREARSKKIEELTSRLEHGGSEPTAAASERASTSPAAKRKEAVNQVHVGVATVDVPPTRVQGGDQEVAIKEVYNKSSETDTVFVYGEARPDPTAVVSKAAFDELKAANGGDDDLGATLGQTTVLPLWDNTALGSKLFKIGAFLDFVDVASKNLEITGTAINGREVKVREQSTKVLVNKGSYMCESAFRGQPVVAALSFQFGSCETFAVTFGSGDSPGSSHETRMQDVVYVYNSRRTQPIAFRFHHEIQSICFNNYQPHLLIGGSSQGHIVVWDIRNAPNPVGVSFPSIRTHSAPIKYVGCVGGPSKNQIVSLSSDGRCCTWSVDNIKHPLQSNLIQYSRDKVVVTCGGVLKGSATQSDSSKVVYASPSGKIFSGLVNATTRTIESTLLGGEGHQGGVNALDYHPTSADPSISNLILTAGSDWCCRVWQGDSSVKVGGFSNAVYDAKWSPTHPAVFAACDASGMVTLWNLLVSTETHIAVLQLEDTTTLGGRGVAAHKICWDDSGEHLLVGAHQGEVFHVGAHIERSSTEEARLRDWVYRSFKIA